MIHSSSLCKQVLFVLFMIFGILSPELSAQEVAKKDEDNMKQYYFVLLTKGDKRDQDSVSVQEIQKGHLENISRLHKEGKINIAGPFLDDTDWRGIFIFDVSTEVEVRSLLQADPAIQSGRLKYIIHPWYSQKGAVLR